MESEQLLSILSVAGRLKTCPRHCWLTPTPQNERVAAGMDEPEGVRDGGYRRESVAEHSWRLALMAMLLGSEPEFAGCDVDRVIRMCLIHDLGEAFTGDIPTFVKTQAEDAREEDLFTAWVDGFPEPQRGQWRALLAEMDAQQTTEAKLYKALDKLEAVITHDECSLSTWLPLEYDLQRTHGTRQVAFSPTLTRLKAAVDDWTRAKIEAEGAQDVPEKSPGTET